jgi:hypothetical protein
VCFDSFFEDQRKTMKIFIILWLAKVGPVDLVNGLDDI